MQGGGGRVICVFVVTIAIKSIILDDCFEKVISFNVLHSFGIARNCLRQT